MLTFFLHYEYVFVGVYFKISLLLLHLLVLIRVVYILLPCTFFYIAAFVNEICVLHPAISEFVETNRLYLETDETELQTSTEIRTRFCSFVCNLVKPVALEHRRNVFSSLQRSRLYYLLARSAGRFGACFAPGVAASAPLGSGSFAAAAALQMSERSSSSLQRLTLALSATSSLSASSTAARPAPAGPSSSAHFSKGVTLERDDGDALGVAVTVTGVASELEFASLRAMCALLCCGPVFAEALLSGDDPSLFRGLDALAASRDSRVCYITHPTLRVVASV